MFNCNERFTAGHKCQGAKLLMLESHAEDDEAVEDDIHNKHYAAEHLEESVEPKITLHALTGWTAPKTMRVTARIGTHAIFTLIDNGSTHNFINERMANLLRLPVVSTKAFTIRVANGENLKCQEKLDGYGNVLVIVTCKRPAHIFPKPSKDHNNDWLVFDGHV